MWLVTVDGALLQTSHISKIDVKKNGDTSDLMAWCTHQLLGEVVAAALPHAHAIELRDELLSRIADDVKWVKVGQLIEHLGKRNSSYNS